MPGVNGMGLGRLDVEEGCVKHAGVLVQEVAPCDIARAVGVASGWKKASDLKPESGILDSRSL